MTAEDDCDPVAALSASAAPPQLAAKLGDAPVQKTSGFTFVDHLAHHRILHAKRPLAATDQKIVDIAFAPGFNSISRFNEAIRRASGCSPRTYRQRHESVDEAVAS
ncbi:MAG: AraC family transcriptional regulator [Verrucomicrobia bacterium]|nr:AraC family transcriptional regulator [Verrucomicrobiota bacterium]